MIIILNLFTPDFLLFPHSIRFVWVNSSTCIKYNFIRIRWSKWVLPSLLRNFTLMLFIRLKPRSQSALEAWKVQQMSTNIESKLKCSSFIVMSAISGSDVIVPDINFSLIRNLKSLYCFIIKLSFVTLIRSLYCIHSFLTSATPKWNVQFFKAVGSKADQHSSSSGGNLAYKWSHTDLMSAHIVG